MFEAIGFTLTQLELWLLIFVRILTFLSIFPFFSYQAIDARFRVFLSILLASIMVRLIPYPEENFPVEFTMLMFYVAREVFIGLCIGMFASFFVEIVKFAGSKVAQAMGLQMAAMIDPATNEQGEVMAEMFHITAILLILAMNGHHFFIRIMADSFFIIPVTGLDYGERILTQIVGVVSAIFSVGLRIAAPIVIIVLFIKVCVGIMNRLVQESDVFSIILVANVLIGLYILQYYWPYFAQMTNYAWTMTQNQLQIILRMLSPTF